jgi:hypothetical protein
MGALELAVVPVVWWTASVVSVQAPTRCSHLPPSDRFRFLKPGMHALTARSDSTLVRGFVGAVLDNANLVSGIFLLFAHPA